MKKVYHRKKNNPSKSCFIAGEIVWVRAGDKWVQAKIIDVLMGDSLIYPWFYELEYIDNEMTAWQ